MPVPRVLAQINCTPAQATQLRTWLESDLPAANKILDRPREWAQSDEDAGRVLAVCDVRLKTRADANALYAKWAARWNNYAAANNITGRVSIHDCTHGEAGQQDCTISMTWVG